MNLKNVLYFAKYHGPAILTVLGCIGVPVTAVLASTATLKSDDMVVDERVHRWTAIIDQENDDEILEAEITKKEIVKLVWKNYIPTVISGGLTIASIIGSNRLSAKEIAMLSASCAGLMSYKAQLEQEVRKRYGEEALEDIRKSVDEKHAKVLIYPEDTGNGDLLCFDGFGGRWFYSSEDAVNMGLCELNQDFMDGEYVCFNDLYKKWNISETHFGWMWGWPANPDYYDGPILWRVQKVEGFQQLDEPVLIIEPLTYPMECWLEV